MRPFVSEPAPILDPALYPLQHGVASGGVASWINANTIRVTTGSGWLQGTDGLLRPVRWAQTDVTVPNAANTRLDQIVVDPTGAITRVAGTTDAAGGTLDNRNGAATGYNAGSGYLRLVDAVATATGVANTAAGFRDRRAWAKGFRGRRSDTSSGPQTVTSGSWTPINPGTFSFRVESSGKQLKWRLQAGVSGGNPGYVLSLILYMDGSSYGRDVARGIDNLSIGHEWSGEADPPSAGSHVFTVAAYWSLAGSSVNISGPSLGAALLYIEEDLRPLNPVS